MKVLIVDDEQLARQRLEKMLESIDGFEPIGQAENGEKALAMIRELNPDIILLDIRMPGVDGLGVANTLANQAEEAGCAVIFTTAYEEHALDAFDLHASGYLLKPVNREKLAKALKQAARLVGSPPETTSEHPDHRSHLSASSRGKVELIPLGNVRLLLAEHKYVTVYHTGGESILDESLKMLEDEFPDIFRRVHRNALVSFKHVKALKKNASGQFVLKIMDTDAEPIVSRRLVTQVRNWMKQL